MFRKSVSDPGLIFARLPVALYPEYHEVHRMMGAGIHQQTKLVRGQQVEREYPGYQAFAQTHILEISKDRHVLIRGPQTHLTVQVRYTGEQINAILL